MHTRATFLALSLLPGLAWGQLPHSDTGDLLVSSFGNDKLLRLDFQGNQLGELTYTGLDRPRGIVAGQNGTVFLVSQKSDEVLVLDRSLNLVRRFPTSFVDEPTGAALGPNGNLFVAGFVSDNVGEFRTDGTFVRTYSGGGLSSANCVAFDPGGGFFVASAANGLVVKFDATGTPAGSFTGFGLSSPMGMAVWNGELFVAGGGSNNIAVFDLAGTPQRQITHPNLAGPQGVAFTAAGVLTTSGFFNHKVSWFLPDGTHLSTVQPASSQVPRSVAYLRGVRIESTGNPAPGSLYQFDVVCPNEPGQIYATALSFSTSPGFLLPDGRLFRLTPDALFLLSFRPSAVFPGFLGLLDANGRATPGINLPNLAGLRGLTMHGGVLTLDIALPTLVRQLSDPVTWSL